MRAMLISNLCQTNIKLVSNLDSIDMLSLSKRLDKIKFWPSLEPEVSALGARLERDLGLVMSTGA